uniref:HNH endonuclease n=1 Tax=Mobiluncus sp. TaxID=47293 RepID=UPI00338F75DE
MKWGGRKVRDLARLAVSVYGSRCCYCHEPIDPIYSDESIYGHNHPRRLSLEHLIPRSRGGSNSIENLRPCHLGCNSRRGDKHAPPRATRFDPALFPPAFFH